MGVKLHVRLRQHGRAFRPGDLIEGIVQVTNDGKKAVDIEGFGIFFLGEERVTWKEESCFWIPFIATVRTTTTYKDANLIVGQCIEPLGKGQLGVGGFDFPFRFKLPSVCPSSYVSRMLNGHISYQIIASLKTSSMFTFNKKETLSIPVLGVLNLVKVPGHAAEEYALERKNGRYRLLVTLPRTEFVPGEQIGFKIQASKDKPFSWTPRVTLCREEHLIIRTGHASDVRTLELAGVRKEKAKGAAKEKGTNLVWEGELRIPVDTVLTDLGGCKHIRINYFLKISGSGVDTMKIPIVLGTGFYGQIGLNGLPLEAQTQAPQSQAVVRQILP